MKKLFLKKAVCMLLICSQLVAFSAIVHAQQNDAGQTNTAQDGGVISPKNIYVDDQEQN